MKALTHAMLAMLTLSAQAWSQNCPAGIPSAGNPACIPPDHSNSPYYQGDSGRKSARWKLTWGAVAVDVAVGDIGVSKGEMSKRRASNAAMERCEKHGAKNCKLILAYQNQCAVVAWPTVVGGTPIVQSGPSIEVATSLALPACSSRSNGRECYVHYADCTSPVLVQ
jgi:hypothetical protein